jgi:hypothetical protein
MVEDERVLEGDRGDRPSLRAEPARGRQLVGVESGENGLDGRPGDLGDDRLRCPS